MRQSWSGRPRWSRPGCGSSAATSSTTRTPSPGRAAPAVLVAEITNETPVPVAIALVGRRGGSSTSTAELVTVDGHHEVAPAPGRASGSRPSPSSPFPTRRRCGWSWPAVRPLDAAELPDAERVAAGWRAQVDAGASWSLPEPTITAAADAARAFLLRPRPTRPARHGAVGRGPAPPRPPGRAGTWADLAARQRLTGAFEDGTGRGRRPARPWSPSARPRTRR